jgi:hypothetical protein
MTKKEIKESKDIERTLYAVEYTGPFDKQKYIRPESVENFLWTNQMGHKLEVCGSEKNLISSISNAMLKVNDGIKLWFFHPDWKRKRVQWRENVRW